MSAEFSGTKDVTVDGAGRIKFPSSFRKVFEENAYGPDVVVAYRMLDGNGFLMVYPERAWKRSLESLSDQPGLSALEVEAIRRKLNRQSEMAVVDRQGRVVLPRRFTDLVGLGPGSDAALVGAGNRIEVWNAAVVDQLLDETSVDDEKIASVLNGR